MGIRNWACTLVSAMIGSRPINVVSEVRTMGLKRFSPASSRASITPWPALRSWLMRSINTRLSLTTTPAQAMTPMREKMLTCQFRIR